MFSQGIFGHFTAALHLGKKGMIMADLQLFSRTINVINPAIADIRYFPRAVAIKADCGERTCRAKITAGKCFTEIGMIAAQKTRVSFALCGKSVHPVAAGERCAPGLA